MKSSATHQMVLQTELILDSIVNKLKSLHWYGDLSLPIRRSCRRVGWWEASHRADPVFATIISLFTLKPSLLSKNNTLLSFLGGYRDIQN